MWLALEPDEPTARRWLRERLARGEFGDAEQSWWQQFQEWVRDLLLTSGGVPAPAAIGVIVVVVVIAVVVIVLVTGPARLASPTGTGGTGAVFGDERVDAQTHRRRAEEFAAAQQWDVAIREATRALIRALAERMLVDSRPGLTADEAAREASDRLPELGARLVATATLFDEVMFGGRPGTQAGYAAVRALDDDAARATPTRLMVGVGGPRLVSPGATDA